MNRKIKNNIDKVNNYDIILFAVNEHRSRVSTLTLARASDLGYG